MVPINRANVLLRLLSNTVLITVKLIRYDAIFGSDMVARIIATKRANTTATQCQLLMKGTNYGDNGKAIGYSKITQHNRTHHTHTQTYKLTGWISFLW